MELYKLLKPEKAEKEWKTEKEKRTRVTPIK